MVSSVTWPSSSREPRRHRRHDDAVAHLDAADARWGEEGVQAHADQNAFTSPPSRSMVAPCSQRPRGENHEGDRPRDVLGGAEPGDADVLAMPLAHFGLALAGALHVGLDAPPKPFGLDVARMDAVDLHAVGLAEVGERLARRPRTAAFTEAPDGEAGGRHAPAGAADGDERAASSSSAAARRRARAAHGRRTSARSPPTSRRR